MTTGTIEEETSMGRDDLEELTREDIGESCGREESRDNE